MKKTALLALMCCVVALAASLGLSACGSSGDQEAANEAFIGTWDLLTLSTEGEEISQENIETLANAGFDVYFEIKEDGSAALVLFGEATEGTWKATSPTAGSVDLEGDTIEMTIEDDVLKMQQGDTSMSFMKGEPRSTDSASQGDASSGEDGEASGASSASSSASSSSDAS